MSDENENKKAPILEIVQGDKENLKISTVKTHLNIEKPKMNNKKNIIIPKEKK